MLGYAAVTKPLPILLNIAVDSRTKMGGVIKSWICHRWRNPINLFMCIFEHPPKPCMEGQRVSLIRNTVWEQIADGQRVQNERLPLLEHRYSYAGEDSCGPLFGGMFLSTEVKAVAFFWMLC